MLRLTALCLVATIVLRGAWSVAQHILATDGQNGKESKEVCMSSITIRVENRACATCKNWKGARGLEKLGSAKVVRCDTTRQPCSIKSGFMTIPGASCGYWTKWTRI